MERNVGVMVRQQNIVPDNGDMLQFTKWGYTRRRWRISPNTLILSPFLTNGQKLKTIPGLISVI
jgi:hypothetical protein